MTFLRRVADQYQVWLKLLLCLAVFSLWVERRWVPEWLAPQITVRMTNPLRTDIYAQLETLSARLVRADAVVFFVGDSAVGGWYDANAILPPKFAAQLAALLPGRHLEVVNLTFIGLYVDDALLMIAKACAFRPALIIYAMSPRIAPTEVAPQYETQMRDLAFEWDVISRVGLMPALRIVGVHGFARALAYSAWPVLRVRTELARATRDGLVRRGKPRLVPLLDALLAPKLGPPPRATVPDLSDPYLWMRAKHRLAPPTPSTAGLDAVIDLCARERRCLLYQIPVNPEGEHGFEPGLLDEFVTYVATRSRAQGVPFDDYRALGRAEDFVTSQRGWPDSIHRTPAGHEAFAPVLAARAAALIEARAP